MKKAQILHTWKIQVYKPCYWVDDHPHSMETMGVCFFRPQIPLEAIPHLLRTCHGCYTFSPGKSLSRFVHKKLGRMNKNYLEPQGQPFINGCFNGMIPNLYIENGCFTKHPFINGCLGFLVVGSFNPFEKYLSNWIISPGRDEHKKCLKPPPR